MRIQHHLALITVLALMTSLNACQHPDGDDDDAVEEGFHIADAALEQCVRGTLGMEDGDLEEGDVAELAHLTCADQDIADVTGLEYFHGLRSLSLWENQITDIGPLSGLTNLQSLQLGNNHIDDITPLAGLTELTRLGLSANGIDDLEALSGLVRLQWLNLDSNAISGGDCEQLCGLSELRWLTVEHNVIGNEDVLDCLQDADIYFDYQGETRSADAGDPPVPATDVLAAPDPTRMAALRAAPVWAAIQANDSLALKVELADETRDVVHEFAGELRLDGWLIVLERGDGTFGVGSYDGRQIQLCSGAYAQACEMTIGRKGHGAHPGLADAAPVVTARLTLLDGGLEQGDWQPISTANGTTRNEELLDYVFASPNQFDAGSCLFMANTGAMEVLLNQHTPSGERDYEGDTDLSERYLMSGSDYVSSSDVHYVITDLTYTYDVHGGSLLNRDYPFAAGYIVETYNGIREASPNEDGAYFSCYYNWINDLPSDWEDMLTETPDVERTVIFVDPDLDSNSIWNVALMNRDIIERIKHELDTKQAPVIIVYNHYLYWHANIIVGYDDEADSNGCPMVESTLNYFEQQGYNSYINKIEAHMEDNGGCSDQGIFYVRDSIYDGGIDEPMYSYSDDYNFEEKYSRRITELSYNWVVYLANHAYSVQRED